MSHAKNQRDVLRLIRETLSEFGGDARVARQGKGAHFVVECSVPGHSWLHVSTRSRCDPRAMRNLEAEIRREAHAAQARKRA